MTISEFTAYTSQLPQTDALFPTIFIGHGSPLNGIEQNEFSDTWKELAKSIQRPAAIVVISAHWITKGSYVFTGEAPKTIHDFRGFPEELYKKNYPTIGLPTLAKEIITKSNGKIIGTTSWGLDHGAWIPLLSMYPNADIPVFQLSLDIEKLPQEHYELGKSLRSLRKKNILIIASGNIVHNLHEIKWEEKSDPFEWAIEFDARVARHITYREHGPLIDYRSLGQSAIHSVPTPDHYWPLLYTLGLQEDEDMMRFYSEKIVHGSVGMRIVMMGK